MTQRQTRLLWKQLLQRKARDSLSLQGQIREMLVGAILDGHLPPATCHLPPATCHRALHCRRAA